MAVDEATQSTGRRPRPGAPVDLYRIKRALWRRKWILLISGVVGVVVGYGIAKYGMTSGYSSTAVLRFEGVAPVAGMLSGDELSSAAEALRRQAVLRRIADEVEFPGTLTTLSGFVRYRTDLRAETLKITVPGATAKEAAAFAGVVTDVFLDYHAEQQGKRIELEIARLNKRIAAGEAETEAARRRYNEFRETHGIADLDTEQQSMLESAAKMRADSELMRSEVRALEAQVESLKTQLATTPRTTVVSGSAPERAAYQDLRQQLATARATLSENHPRVQALQQQVARLRAQVRGAPSGGQVATNITHEEIKTQLQTAQSNLRALEERQRGLSELADKAEARIEDFSDIEGEASALLAEVKVNENLVQGLRQTEAALEDALRHPSSGFVVLDPGSVPEYPERNKKKLLVFVAVPALLFGLALVFAMFEEFRGLRVQTPAEVAFWGHGPALGTTSWPKDPLGLDELVAGLDDHAPDSRGTVLVLGATPEDTPLAVELAERMNDDWVIAAGPQSAAEPARPPSSGPIRTPPPSGPYPITRSSPSTALATRPSARPLEVVRAEPGVERLDVEAWTGPFEGQALRRAARLADRVLVLVRSGATSALTLQKIRHRLGRERGIGFVVVELPEELTHLADRAGDVGGFWAAT